MSPLNFFIKIIPYFIQKYKVQFFSNFNSLKVFIKFYGKNPLILGPGVKTGVQLKVDDPKTVGADIICDCAGVKGLADEAIVVDLGTATKYIYVKNQVFYGVSIAPGVSVSMKALVNSAALLPSVELVCPKKVIGTSTVNCIQSGVIYGAAAQVDGMIDRIKEEIGNPNIILTGRQRYEIKQKIQNEEWRIKNL